jgi:hypothetical protein
MLKLDIQISEIFLNKTPNAVFVFGDNLERHGYGGGAILRDHPQAYGFITKKFPDNRDTSFYHPYEYEEVFFEELEKLKKLVEKNQNKIFYISKLGGGLANKYHIWEDLVKENLESTFNNFENVIFCWT